jgi:hypothetical protein
MSHSNNERGSQMDMVQPSYYKNSKREMNNFKRKQKQDSPLAKMFFYFIAETFICFPLSKFQKWIDSFHLYIDVRQFLTLMVCANTVGFPADKCRFRTSNGDKEKTSRNEHGRIRNFSFES